MALPAFLPYHHHPPKLRYFITWRLVVKRLIGEFIVSRHEEIIDNLQSQRGALFASSSLQARALIEADYHLRVLVLQVYGRDSKEYLSILYDEMRKVFGELNLDYREWVTLPRFACLDSDELRFSNKVEKAPYQQLLAFARSKEQIFISESGLKYDLNKVLGTILSKEGLAKVMFIIEGDYVEGSKKVNKQNIKVGDGVNIGSGSFNIESLIDDSFNNLKNSNLEIEAKSLLRQLLMEIKNLNDKAPISQNDKIQIISEETQVLINESSRELPRKRWYQARVC